LGQLATKIIRILATLIAVLCFNFSLNKHNKIRAVTFEAIPR
jgi:hypothetical protein